MKNSYSILFLFFGLTLQAQTLTGKWKTIDDETGEAKSIVEIYEYQGLYYGKIINLLSKDDQGKRCEKCTGKDHNQPIEGLVILKGLKKNGDIFKGGQILDPKSGKTYKCEISFSNSNELKVRGYIGISLIGRSQVWKRVL
jgi:uncharacterized protein (DUF2147 family)